jgi:uncharacterized protein (UPF0335 family)
MNPTTRNKLNEATKRIAALESERKTLGFEIKELIDTAYEQTGVRKKNIKALAKLQAYSKEERADFMEAEEQFDECAVALGLLKDLPLGQAAMEASKKDDEEKKPKAKDKPKSKPKAKKEPVEATHDAAEAVM